MDKSAVILPSEQLATFARLAHVLEEASTLLWEISMGNTDALPALPKDIDALAETDPALADTLALMVNDEAKDAIQASITAVQQGRARSAREFFNEL